MPLAPCGLDCEACSLRPKECDGCHVMSDHQWHADCGVRVCCLYEKQLSNCSECDDFPCEKVLAFEADKWAHHTAAVATLRRMRAARPGRPAG